MSSRGLRFYHDFLYTIDSQTYPSTAIQNAAIPDGSAASSTTACFIGFPLESNIYPLSLDDNQISIEWNIRTMPTGATYVQLTPISMAGFTQFPGRPSIIPGIDLGYGAYGLQRFTFDGLDTTNNRVNPGNYTIYRTAADTTLALPDSKGISRTFALGTHHLIPVADPYIGFFIEHDGTNATGSHSIVATMRWT